ncbi:MAG: ABC transporter ATP-binding protein [Candidatus Kariarchaeaceae archaeon]
MNDYDVSIQTNLSRAEKHPMRWLIELVMQYKLVTFFVIIGIIIHQTLRFVIPVLIGLLVDRGIVERDPEAILYYSLAVLIVGIISPFFDAAMSWGNEYLAASVERDVRSIYFQSLQAKNMAFHDSVKIGELLAVSQNDMRSLYSSLAPGIRIFGEAFVSLVSLTIIIFLQQWILGIVFLLMIPIWILSLKWYNNRLTPISVSQQDKFREVNAQVQENLSGAEVVRAFTQVENETERFQKENVNYTSIWESRGKITALYFPMLVSYLMGGVLFLSSAFLATRSSILIGTTVIPVELTLGEVVTMVGLIVQLRGPTFLLGRVLEFTSLGLAGVRKVQALISEDSSLAIAEEPIQQDIKGHVEFDSVSFRYAEELILDNISFTAVPGEIVAIVGPTGSGKTTLLKLLTRLYDPDSGSIRVDSVDLRDYDLKSLRSEIATVEQDIYLFSTSIKENIAFAARSEHSEEELQKVMEIARVNEFVHELPQKENTLVGERGMRLSGGQRQRIGIARAFLVDPKILILDDSTSAVDSETEQQIVGAIRSVMKSRTSFIVTARLNMIRQADKVLVIDKGKIVGQGTHNDLLLTNLIYRRIFDPHMELPEANQ